MAKIINSHKVLYPNIKIVPYYMWNCPKYIGLKWNFQLFPSYTLSPYILDKFTYNMEQTLYSDPENIWKCTKSYLNTKYI